MSMQALFGQFVNQLQAQSWKSPDGQKMADILTAIFSDESPISLDQPITIINNTAQAAINITGVADSRAIEITTPGGQVSSMGVGVGNTGLIANEFVPMPEYMLPADVASQYYSTVPNKAGGTTATPGELRETTRPYNTPPLSAPGILPSNTPTGVGGQTGQTFSGRGRATGYPVLIAPGTPVEHEIASGGGPGSGGSSPSGLPVLKYAGTMPVLKGRATGSGVPGRTHTGMQNLVPWGESLAYARHGDNGLEVTVGNRRYFWPLNGGPGSGATGTQTVVTAVSCTAGTLSVTTATLNFINGLYTGTT